MRILAVDDELPGLGALKSAIAKAEPDAEICAFRSPSEALKFAEENDDIYAALLDVQMIGMSGIELARKIKLVRPKVHIIFATGFDEYMKDAFQLHANGYIMKPVTPAKVREELDNLKSLREEGAAKPAPAPQISDKRVRLQCFGNFEVFVDGVPLRFKYDKTKEVLAYIVSRRGAMCSSNEIIVNIWDDDGNHDSYLRGIRKDLVDTLAELGCEEAVILQRGKLGINASKVSCDYYDFLEGSVAAINAYSGEFMAQYSFAETLNAELDFQRNKA